jgi:hypothetical protein
MLIQLRKSHRHWLVNHTGTSIIIISLLNWFYRPIEESPHQKYEHETTYEGDKENSPCLSNGIEAYSPPSFVDEKPMLEHRKMYRSPVPFAELNIHTRDTRHVQKELNPIEHPISPCSEEPFEATGRLPINIAALIEDANDAKSICMFNDSLRELPQSNSENISNNISNNISKNSSKNISKGSIKNIKHSKNSYIEERSYEQISKYHPTQILNTEDLDPTKFEITKGNPFILNIQSRKEYLEKEKSNRQSENMDLEQMSESSDSVLWADYITDIQPMLIRLNRKMKMEDEAAKLKLKLYRSKLESMSKSKPKSKPKPKPNPKLKNKKRKSSINLYRHVPSKVAESIRGHGSVISYPCRMKRTRPMSEARVTNKKYRSVKPKVKSQFRAGSVRSGWKKSKEKQAKISKF